MTIKDILQTAIIKVEPIEEYYLIENNEDIEIENKIIQEHRESIIQITIVESGDLYQKLSNICDLEIKPTFSHVTLFTSSNIESRKLRGIGLYSKNDFNEIKKEKLSF